MHDAGNYLLWWLIIRVGNTENAYTQIRGKCGRYSLRVEFFCQRYDFTNPLKMFCEKLHNYILVKSSFSKITGKKNNSVRK
jgi:hypothetical protein